MSLRLRAGAAQDHPALARIWEAAWRATLPQIDFAARRSFIEAALREAEAGRYRLRLAECAGAPAGFTLTDAEGLLEQIAVEPAHWGGGVARALLADAKAWAPEGLRLVVNQVNARAIRFYEREGFVRTGAGINPNSGLPTIFMAWRAPAIRP